LQADPFAWGGGLVAELWFGIKDFLRQQNEYLSGKPLWLFGRQRCNKKGQQPRA
jgi:hypothetical protein